MSISEKMYIPKILKVGYQKRTDTYSGKLAYVIYYDDKGVLRKEASWESWRNKEITADELPNNPISGYVLNRDVGGVRRSYGWDQRLEKVRVWHPNGFEFEISIPNLLFILQECNSTKGKGLEGEFVFAWSGKDLVLLPTCCEIYKKSTEFTHLQGGKISSKDMIPGHKYIFKDTNEYVYLGKHKPYGIYYNENNKFRQNIQSDMWHHVFVSVSSFIDDNTCSVYRFEKDTKKISKRTTVDIVDDYAEVIDEYLKSRYNTKMITYRTQKHLTLFNDIDDAIKSNNRFYNNTSYIKISDTSDFNTKVASINLRYEPNYMTNINEVNDNYQLRSKINSDNYYNKMHGRPLINLPPEIEKMYGDVMLISPDEYSTFLYSENGEIISHDASTKILDHILNVFDENGIPYTNTSLNQYPYGNTLIIKVEHIELLKDLLFDVIIISESNVGYSTKELGLNSYLYKPKYL